MNDRHVERMTQMRLMPNLRETIQKASLEYDVPMNWIINRALMTGLPKVLHLLAELHGKPIYAKDGE